MILLSWRQMGVRSSWFVAGSRTAQVSKAVAFISMSISA